MELWEQLFGRLSSKADQLGREVLVIDHVIREVMTYSISSFRKDY